MYLSFQLKVAVSYRLGTERTALGGRTKLTHWCGGEEVWLCKMSRRSSRAGMGCDSCQCTSAVVSGTENTFQGLIIKGQMLMLLILFKYLEGIKTIFAVLLTFTCLCFTPVNGNLNICVESWNAILTPEQS